MSIQIQLRRGVKSENDGFIGAEGEVTVDTTTHNLRIHDRSKAGGWVVDAASDVVHKTGDETISGEKDFDSAPRFRTNLTPSTNSIKPSAIEDVLIASSKNTNSAYDGMKVTRLQRSNGNREVLYTGVFNDTYSSIGLGVNTSGQKYTNLAINSYAYAPTPSSPTDNSIQIATTEWVNNNRGVWTTNCITEIPQDIKLELNNGTLTLKAGSKVYAPNGTDTFDSIVIANDLVMPSIAGTRQVVAYVIAGGTSLNWQEVGTLSSGATDSLAGTEWHLWYDTTNNIIKRYGDSGAFLSSGHYFPIALCTVTSGVITSIDQVFNGFGYIGSTVFALPGVKGLIPNGRNSDGTLKNIVVSLTSVCTVSYTSTNTLYFGITGGNHLYYQTKSVVSYDESTNTTNWQTAIIAEVKVASGVISDFMPKNTFHAVDYNEYQEEISKVVNYDNISNCITNIPQDIKLKLNNGTLTLKAGSKVYIPNGSGIFTQKTTTNDINCTITNNSTFAVCIQAEVDAFDYVELSRTYSGTTNPQVTYSFWYDTTNNLVKLFIDNTTTPARTESLPIAIVTVTNGAISSIDQVFNGFGYIGSTVFALPGVKGLAPNGFNVDGTLKNTLITISNVTTKAAVSSGTKTLSIRGPGIVDLPGGMVYDSTTNYNYNYGELSTHCICGTVVIDNNLRITSLSQKNTFHAVDYNDMKLKQDKETAINYDNVTNCITEIPQDIKLELTSGTLTLKAGSKVYVPNGAGVFDEVIVQNNITTDSTLGTITGDWFLFYNNGGYGWELVSHCYSGDILPTGAGENRIGYNTSTNKMMRSESGGAYTELTNYSFPVCQFSTVNGTITSINQVFNGFGYIGSTVFALPGVKCLIPDGRNSDGSLKSIEYTIPSVKTYTSNVNWPGRYLIGNDGNIYWIAVESEYYEQTTTPSGFPAADKYATWYNPDTNIILRSWNNEPWTKCSWTTFAKVNGSSNKITSLKPKTVFHAVDYNDVANLAMPSSKYINLTLGASGSTYVAPADGYVFLQKASAGTDQFLLLSDTTTRMASVSIGPTNYGLDVWLPVKKGTKFKVEYTATGVTGCFRFIYANGAA